MLFVYEGDRAADFDAAERVADQLVTEIGATTSEGQTFRIDARLRPEGKQGPLARSLGGYAHLLRALGPHLGAPGALEGARRRRRRASSASSSATLVDAVVYGDPFTEDDVREVRRMKARIERERIPPGEDPQFHLKLGRGSLSDIEFTCSSCSCCTAATIPSCGCPARSTHSQRLHDAGLLADDDADALEAAYRFCERARNARYLQSGSPSDALPSGRAEIEKLGLLLGYVHRPATSLRDDYRRLTRRARPRSSSACSTARDDPRAR